MEEDKKYFGKNALAHLKLLIEKAFQKKEFKTGSESEYKVLSDNNLSDELVQKINEAGNSKFSGDYNDLTGIPTLDGTELKGTLTKEDLGIAAKTDIPTNNNQLTNGAGYQTAKDVEGIINGKGYQTVDDVETAITEKGYQTASDVNIAITSKGYQTDTQVTTAINKAIANINKKSVVTSIEEMTDTNTIYLMANKGSGNNINDEYIIVNGKPEKVGTTEADLTGYLKEADLVELSNEEIDEIFNS